MWLDNIFLKKAIFSLSGMFKAKNQSTYLPAILLPCFAHLHLLVFNNLFPCAFDAPSRRSAIWWLVRMASCPLLQSPVWSAKSRQWGASSSQPATTQEAPTGILASSTTSPVEVSRDWVVHFVLHHLSHQLSATLLCLLWGLRRISMESVQERSYVCVHISIHTRHRVTCNVPFLTGLFTLSLRSCSRRHHKQNIWDQQKSAGVSHLPGAESGSVQNQQADIWSGHFQALHRYISMDSRFMIS